MEHQEGVTFSSLIDRLKTQSPNDRRVKNDPQKIRAIVQRVLQVDDLPSAPTARLIVGFIALFMAGLMGLGLLFRQFETPITDGYDSLERFAQELLPNSSEWTHLFVMTLIILSVLFMMIFVILIAFRLVRGILLPSRYKRSFGYDLQTYFVRLILFTPLLVAVALGVAIQRWANEADVPAGLALLILITVPIAGFILPMLILDALPMIWAIRPLKRGDYASAMRRVEWLMRYQMRRYSAENLKALVLYYQGRFGEAEEIWRDMAKQVPTAISDITPRRLENLGWAVLFQERYEEATDIFMAILDIKPSWNGAYLGLAEICLFQRQATDHAEVLAKRAMQFGGPLSERDRRGQFLATYGWALGRNRQHQMSEDSLQGAVQFAKKRKFNPINVAVLLRVAISKKEKGDMSTASKYFEQVCKLDPQGFYGQWAMAELSKLGFAISS